MFTVINMLLRNVPLEGWRTIILGYLTTTIPAVLDLVSKNPTGAEFYYQLAMILAGPLIHYYRNMAK
mgnify:CR=1 FL=1